MTISLEPQVLQRACRALVHHGLAIRDAATIPVPDTGTTSDATAVGLAHLTEESRGLADRLTHLAVAVEQLRKDAFGFDGEVSGLFDQLAAGSLR